MLKINTESLDNTIEDIITAINEASDDENEIDIIILYNKATGDISLPDYGTDWAYEDKEIIIIGEGREYLLDDDDYVRQHIADDIRRELDPATATWSHNNRYKLLDMVKDKEERC